MNLVQKDNLKLRDLCIAKDELDDSTMNQPHLYTRDAINNQNYLVFWFFFFSSLFSSPFGGLLLLPTSFATLYPYKSGKRTLGRVDVMPDLHLLPLWKCWVYYTSCYGMYALVSYHPMYYLYYQHEQTPPNPLLLPFSTLSL